MDFTFDRDAVLQLGWKAAETLLFYYGGDVAVQRKSDASPVTQADHASHAILREGLKHITPNIPIISEEDTQHKDVSEAEYYWLVDPLDGTKSFIKGTDEFTINIGLMHHHRPVWGLLVVPVMGLAYMGGVNESAQRINKAGETSQIRCAAEPAAGEAKQVLVSFSHMDSQTQAFVDALDVVETRPSSSAYKFCLIADGGAHIYPRFGPTMEWDTAAGHAIVEAAGGSVVNPDGSLFEYGKETLKNGAFIARGWRV